MKWHIAISPKGVSFRVEPEQELPEGWVRAKPDYTPSGSESGGCYYFNPDGSLKERFTRLPIYGD